MNENTYVDVTVKEPKSKHSYARCYTCNKDSQKVEIMALVNKHEKITVDEHGNCIDFWEDHQILKCCGCESIFFRVTEKNSEDFEEYYNPDLQSVSRRFNKKEMLFPEIENSRKLFNEFELLPDQLKAIYIETARALHSNQPVLTGIGIRAIVETICKDKNSVGKDLNEKINGLKDLGVLTTSGAEILHKLRVLGNNSAHEVKAQREDQLLLAFDVLDNLLSNVYVLQPKAASTF